MSIHAVEVTIEPLYGVEYRATCSDLAADCHYVCAEGCETWGEIVRNEDGRVLWHTDFYDREVRHQMSHSEECNYVSFLRACDDFPESMEGEPFKVTIPARFIFDGCDVVTWEARQP